MDNNSISLYTKINSLPKNLKKEVSDFIDFLLSKSKKDKKRNDKKGEDLRSLLLRGPVFNDHQIEQISEAREHINKWRTI